MAKYSRRMTAPPKASMRSIKQATCSPGVCETSQNRTQPLTQFILRVGGGHALARSAEPDAVEVLSEFLSRLGPTFIRAETALRVDLARAFTILNEPTEATEQAQQAASLASR